MLIDLYGAAKWGKMQSAAFNASSGSAVDYRISRPTKKDHSLYAIRSTEEVRIRQGAHAVTAASATTASYLSPDVYYPILIENEEDCYISLLGGSTEAGALEITLVSETEDWSLGPSGNGDSLAYSGGSVTITCATAYFQATDVGKYITIISASNAANNGTFLITAVTDATHAVFTNASGVNETSTFGWYVKA